MVKKYVKKPVVVEAIQFTGKNQQEIRQFCGHTAVVRDTGDINISTLEGWMTASPGDYIIKGIAGEFYPCKSDIFHQTYTELK